jgi:hypothetical protein
VILRQEPGGPAWCPEHGELPGRLITGPEARILLLEHLRDVHGEDHGELIMKLKTRGRAITSGVPA